MGDIQEDVDNNDDLDPRIQDELNLLNSSSNDINRLENEIDEARVKYRSTFSDASHKMETMGKELKRYIQRARQYYHLKEAAVQAQSEALRAARQYQTANGVYRAAKETIALAEQKLMDDQSAAMLSSAWQEMLNHATTRVMEAERDKTRSEEEHMRRSNIFANLESKLQYLEKKFKKSIHKSRPYFEMKAELELRLQQQKQNIDDLQNAIKSSKKQYSESLRRLEGISDEIHESRRQKILLMFPREPGVGADDESLGSSISDPNLDRALFSLSSPGEDHMDSDIEDSHDVFGCDSHVTSDSPDSSSISLSELSKDLPASIEDESEINNTDHSKDANSRGDNSPPIESQADVNSCARNFSATNNGDSVVNGGREVIDRNCDISTIEQTVVVCERVVVDVNVSGRTEERQCGSGAEQSPVCGDSVTSRDSCDVLPERDVNQTEGSSDPEEFVKDVKVAENQSHTSDEVLSTDIL